MKPKPISIVPLTDIPKALDTPTDNLLKLFQVVTQMEQLCEKQQGIGLAAAQIGLPWNLFVVNRLDSYEYYVNCQYEGIGEKEKSIEGCLSLRDDQGKLRRFEVDRYSKVSVKGKQLKIKIVNESPVLVLEDFNHVETGLYSIVFQHEIDHAFQRERMIDIIGREIEILN